MDIPHDSPEKERGTRDKKKGGPALEIETGDLVIASLAGDVVSSQGNIAVLDYMKQLHLESESRRSPMDGPETTDSPISGIEAFFLSDHTSHLSKIASLEDQLEKSQRAVQILDETDFSGKTLYDFVPTEMKDELENQLNSLKERANIRESVESEVGAFCGEIWDDYKRTKSKTEPDRKILRETLLLGPDAPKKEKKDLDAASKTFDEIETLGELIGLEKARLVMRALNANTKEFPEKAADAEKILGSDFGLICAQVAHMEDTLQKDWEDPTARDGIIDPTQGKSLLCTEILNRMEPLKDKDGKPTAEKNASDEQIKSLEDAYMDAASRKTNSELPRDRTNRKIAFVLAAMQVMELGKRARVGNLLKTVRELDTPEINLDMDSEEAKENPGKNRLSRWIKEKGLAAGKKILSLPKQGVGAVAKQWPQALFLGAIGHMWKQNMDVDGKHYGGQEQHVAFMKEALGELNSVS